MVQLIASLDEVFEEHLKTATVFKGTSKTVQNELLDCMAAVIRARITEEVKSASFVAIQADETTISRAAASSSRNYRKKEGLGRARQAEAV